MGAKRRTPVLWPRMKVRGARRRALVAMRLTRVTHDGYGRSVEVNR